MATILKFDEINKLSEKRQRSLPYEQYFGEMELSDEQKEKRIELAKALEKQFLFVFTMIRSDIVAGNTPDKDYYSEMLSRRYFDTLILFGLIVGRLNPKNDSERNLKNKPNVNSYSKDIKRYVDDISDKMIDSTIKNKDDAYTFSQDRIRFASENESNTIMNSKEYSDAIAEGYKRKQWITEKDDKVRNTHRYVDDEIIGIHDLFDVGDCQMRFPRDADNGSADEIVNCRCTIKYLK